MVQWLGLGALTEAEQWVWVGDAQVQFLVRELRSHKPCGAAPNPNKQQTKLSMIPRSSHVPWEFWLRGFRKILERLAGI